MPEEMKVCRKCNVEQPISMFSVANWPTGARKARCRACETARTKAYYAEHSGYRASMKARAQAWVKANPEKAAKSRRKGNLKRTYGLSEAQFAALLELQGGKCALCKSGSHGRSNIDAGSWMVDHGHTTHDVRGLLCTSCNVSLGHYERLIKNVGEAMLLEYLSRPCPVPEIRAAAAAHPPVRHKWVECSVDGCHDHIQAKGLCARHYMRQKRTGKIGGAGSLYPVQNTRRSGEKLSAGRAPP